MSHHQLEKVSCSRQFDFVPNHFRGTFLCSFEVIPTMPWVPEAFSLRKVREWTCGARIFKNNVLSLIQLPFSNTSLTFTIHWQKFLISFLRTCIGSMDSNIIWSYFDIVWSFFPYPLGCSLFLQHLNIFWKKHLEVTSTPFRSDAMPRSRTYWITNHNEPQNSTQFPNQSFCKIPKNIQTK